MPSISFSLEVATTLEEKHRLPPTFIGARRVRPSNKAVRDVLKQKYSKKVKRSKESTACDEEVPSAVHSSNDGVCAEGKQSPIPTNPTAVDVENSLKTEADKDCTASAHHKSNNTDSYTKTQDELYFQFEVDHKSIQQEISEMSGETRTVPIVLSDPMADQITFALNQDENHDEVCMTLDYDLSNYWAKAIQESMKEAEAQRAKEDMRPMAYRLVPEVWTRLVSALPTRDSKVDTSSKDAGDTNKSSSKGFNHSAYLEDTIYVPASREQPTSLSPSPLHPAAVDYETSLKIIYQYLFRQYPTMHIACGSKFGSDYILYDGPRKERHAFAGLRVLEASHHQCMYLDEVNGMKVPFPIPNAYDLVGYVRTLNKAGKLAILGMVVKDDGKDSYRILLIDLALEKILSAPTHQRKYKKSSQKRKEVGQHLSKR